MTTGTLENVLTILQAESKNWHVPVITLVAERSKDPFQILSFKAVIQPGNDAPADAEIIGRANSAFDLSGRFL